MPRTWGAKKIRWEATDLLKLRDNQGVGQRGGAMKSFGAPWGRRRVDFMDGGAGTLLLARHAGPDQELRRRPNPGVGIVFRHMA